MRRPLNELPFSARTPRQSRMPEDDRGVTFAHGRHWRDERVVARDDPDYSATVEDQRVLRLRQLEAADARQAHADANLARAVELGAALKVLKGED